MWRRYAHINTKHISEIIEGFSARIATYRHASFKMAKTVAISSNLSQNCSLNVRRTVLWQIWNSSRTVLQRALLIVLAEPTLLVELFS